MWGLCPHTPEVYRFGFQEGMRIVVRKGRQNAALPQDRQSARVAPQRCSILSTGEAIIL